MDFPRSDVGYLIYVAIVNVYQLLIDFTYLVWPTILPSTCSASAARDTPGPGDDSSLDLRLELVWD